jgi:ATP-dependent Clp protease ATP-binding subunit ClpA
VIQQKVEDRLSDSLLAGTFEDCETILVDYDEEEDEIILRRGEDEAQEPNEPAEAVPAS